MTRVVRDEFGHLKAVPSWRPLRYTDMRPVTGPVFLAVNTTRAIDARLTELERRQVRHSDLHPKPAAPLVVERPAQPPKSPSTAPVVPTGVWPGTIVGRPK